jgi:hypothetical protein
MHEEIKSMLNSVSAAPIYFRIVSFSFLPKVIAADSEGALQISIHKVKTFTSKYGLKVSRGKKKTMVFKARDPVRIKIVINNNTTEQTNTFNYLGRCISCQNEKCITVKISEFLQITGIINRNFKPSPVPKHTRLKTNDTLALPNLSYGCET